MSQNLLRSPAVRRGLVLVCLALAAACGARPQRGTTSSSSSEERDLQVAVERLRLERRLRERKIRDLENQLATRGETPSQSMSDIPNLPVQVLSPKGGRAKAANDAASDEGRAPAQRRDERVEVSRLSQTSGGRGAANDNLPGELTVDGERVIGVADDGSEIVYVDDAATGRVVSPSAEVLAEVGRSSGRRPAPASPLGSRSPDIDEGDARDYLDSDGAVASAEHDRLPPLQTPLSSISRRAARTRAQPTRMVLTPQPLSSTTPPAVTTAPMAGPPTPAIANNPARLSASEKPSVRGSDNGAAETAYRDAIAQIRRAEYPEAISSLRGFLERYPRHDYADNAQYWLGEAFYAQRQYEQSLVELRRVAELYPQGNKAPDALLKVGYCHLAMGDRDKGQSALREVIRLYPRSQPALLAAKKLEEGK